MADKVADLKMTLSFLENIKYKKKFTIPSDTNIFTCSFHYYFAGQPLFTNFILLSSEDRKLGPDYICHFNDKIFIYHLTFLIIIAL